MNKRVIATIAAIIILFSVCGCKKVDLKDTYEKENAGGTGYGAIIKSALYIDDFYFLTHSTAKTDVDIILGNAHYWKNNDMLSPVYYLNNGDTISITYDERENRIESASYIYSTGETVNFFDILVELGLLKSTYDNEGNGPTVIIPSTDPSKEDEQNNPTDDKPNNAVKPDSSNDENANNNHQTVIQGDLFATGMYNLTLIEAVLTPNLPRSAVLSAVGKPNYFYSQTFANDSYIVDCYNLNDGSKLYIDYGYERDNLRCAAVYKGGTYTSIVGSWSVQQKPNGFTRTTVTDEKIKRIKKNMTPLEVYEILGEPSWYEGTRGNYNDVFALTSGGYAYLNFGTAHNKLTNVSIKGADGIESVVTLS